MRFVLRFASSSDLLRRGVVQGLDFVHGRAAMSCLQHRSGIIGLFTKFPFLFFFLFHVLVLSSFFVVAI